MGSRYLTTLSASIFFALALCLNTSAFACRTSLTKAAQPRNDYPRFSNFNGAMSSAVQWLTDRGFQGTLERGWEPGKLTFKSTGSTALNTFNGLGPNGERVQLRIEFHPIKELEGQSFAHINILFGKEKGPHFIFPGNQADVDAILRQLQPTLGR